MAATPALDASPETVDGASLDSGASDVAPDSGPLPDATADADAGTALKRSITADFRAWLDANGYAAWDFARDDIGGSFGGRAAKDEAIVKMPVVFVHGNSDAANARTATLRGWDASRTYFMAKGYTDASLYGTTWGPADTGLAGQQVHGKAHLTRTRAFLEAVLAYTGAPRIAVVAHSMGVTLSRKAIEGGPATDAAAYDLGPPLTAKVDTFVGIAGGNLGLTACYSSPTVPTCNATTGFYPGASALSGPSTILAAMNATSHDEAAYVFSIFSTGDELVGFGGIVYGKYTSRIPGQDGEVRRDALGHMALKDETADAQYQLVTTHAP